MSDPYPIGTPGTPWGSAERAEWLAQQTVQRSYHDEVVAKLNNLAGRFEVAQYGSLPIDADRYPLYAVTVRADDPSAPWVLISGGVHGYETSGVQGALAFLIQHADSYRGRCNVLVAPCVSPWGYETINRWNPNCVDPNRSFLASRPSEESAAVMDLVASVGAEFLMHLDLHETTDTDETEFRPALAARDGVAFEPGTIPDGFYTVGDSSNPQPEFQAAIIAGVEHVTHIAPPDEHGQLLGEDTTQHGVINYPCVEWALCAAVTTARFTSTTEVYPDSSTATAEMCISAQLAAACAALDFALDASR